MRFSYSPFSRGWEKTPKSNELAKRVTRYLIEKVLRWDTNEVKKSWSQQIIKKFKFSTALQKYQSSPYAMFNDAYPNCIKEWELAVTPKNFWTKHTAIEALRWTIEEKEQLTDEQLLKIYSAKWLAKQGLKSPLGKYWSWSPYAMLNDLYPNRFPKEKLKGYRNKSLCETILLT
ncbi:hypothetical protein [Bacillus sp. DX3.1]|uniref:hypothetical protein n=1 Tax=Bacillus sp. DX3.1 TaxID=3052091 RepID=UPI0025709955|nr:hypothetical protein [Bacillus sp. DX3.1]WJE84614.1 hypothetical protein QRE67_28300 [Bacillus sp. DX3.1]